MLKQYDLGNYEGVRKIILRLKVEQMNNKVLKNNVLMYLDEYKVREGIVEVDFVNGHFKSIIAILLTHLTSVVGAGLVSLFEYGISNNMVWSVVIPSIVTSCFLLLYLKTNGFEDWKKSRANEIKINFIENQIKYLL